ncbi:MAG: NnrU family protein [Hyphomonadaceae bacterium]|nr:NnrU family protein [Hyphomonadaceae bacterium]
MQISNFTLALAAFVLIHVGISATGLRGRLVGALGERVYRGLFALASLAILVWLVIAFGRMRADPADLLNTWLWVPPAWTRHAAQALALAAFLLVVPGLLTANPTTAGFEKRMGEDAAKGIVRITRHPFLWGVALWAAGHLLANGERYAVMLFGALGLMALYGARSIDRKSKARDPEAWSKFLTVTSNIPFAAIVQGRNKLVLGELWWKLLVAVVVYAAVAYGHVYLVGVSAVP